MKVNNITPGQSIGEVKLGSSIQDVRGILGPEESAKRYRSEVEKLEYIDMIVWFEAGMATQIAAQRDFSGSTPQGIHIGSTQESIALKWPFIRDDDGFWLSNQLPGLLFEFQDGVVARIYVHRST